MIDPVDKTLSRLACPSCRGALARIRNGSTGILACACREYPIVDGIPIFQDQMVGHPAKRERLVSLIKNGRSNEALRAVMCPPPPPASQLTPRLARIPDARGIWRFKQWSYERARRRWMRRAAEFIGSERNGTADDEFAFFRGDSSFAPDTWNYFQFRYGQPRHLVALSCLSVLSATAGAEPVLEVACGCGHLTAAAGAMLPGRDLIGIDRVFYFLHLAKRRMAPGALFMCCDVEEGLPLRDAACSAVFCADAIHYFTDKARFFSEAQRITTPNGIILGISIRNALTPQLHRCLAMSPGECRGALGHAPHRIVSDLSVLERYLAGSGPQWSCDSTRESLDAAPLFSVVISRQEEIFRNYGRLAAWPHAMGRLRLNPLYAVTRQSRSSVELARQSPSQFFDEENQEADRYLPRHLAVSLNALDAIDAQRRTPEVERLIEACVVIGVPLLPHRDGSSRNARCCDEETYAPATAS